MAGETVKMIARQNYEALLMDYAAGTLDEAQSLIVACHLTLSPRARRVVSQCEAIGGGLLDNCCDQVEMDDDSLDKVLSFLDEYNDGEPTSIPVVPVCPTMQSLSLPQPILNYMKSSSLSWRTFYPGMHSFDIVLDHGRSKARLLKIDPGTKTPSHSHGGTEITLMIDGAAHDEVGIYKRGDLIVMDERITHMPVADEDLGCICLVVNAEPIRLTGWMGKFINPFLKS